MSKPDAPKFVTALFSFKGKNNDEVCQIFLSCKNNDLQINRSDTAQIWIVIYSCALRRVIL